MAVCFLTSVIVVGNHVGLRNAGDGPGRISGTLLSFPSKDGVVDRIQGRPWHKMLMAACVGG